MEGGPRPSARVGGNYGQTVGRQRDETWLPYTRGGRLGSLPSMGYVLGGKLAYTRGKKLGEGRAGAPGDQALLHRAGFVREGGPRPPARVGGNYGQAEGAAEGRDMVTLHARGRLGSLPSMGYARGGDLGSNIFRIRAWKNLRRRICAPQPFR